MKINILGPGESLPLEEEEQERGREGCEEKKEENIKKSENRNKHVRTRREPATRGRGRGREGGEENRRLPLQILHPILSHHQQQLHPNRESESGNGNQ